MSEQAEPQRTIAIIAAYNEDRFVGSVVLKTRPHVDEIIVVDDGSYDQTAQIAAQAGAYVISHSHNSGKAQAINTGLHEARKRQPSAVVLIDADGQHDPNDIPALLAPILNGETDLVIGSRFLEKSSDTPRWRVAGQVVLNIFTNVASGVPLTDSQSGFRALSSKALQALEFRPNGGFSIESEMQFLIQQHRLTVQEVPVVMNYAEGPKRNPVRHGSQVLNGIIVLVSQHRPLLFFGFTGATVLAIGLLLGLVVVDRYNRYQNLAVGYALIAIMLAMVGMQALFTGMILQAIRSQLRSHRSPVPPRDF